VNIKEATEKDFDGIWPIFSEVVKSGDTYAYPQNITKENALKVWIHEPSKTFIVEENNNIVGTYYLKKNQSGPGSHVCNCGYMVASSARGKGIASAMCEHSQKIALELGYKAMQFNFVASTNKGAIGLWNKLGFKTAGCLPKAFNHPSEGFVDALVMFKWLE